MLGPQHRPRKKEVTVQTALIVPQIEISLVSRGDLLFGLTVICYGMALLVDRTYPKWIGGLAIVGGGPQRSQGA